MDSVTQQNAALVEEASAASKSMEQQSAQLVMQIGYFRTNDISPVRHVAAAAEHKPRAVTAPVRKAAKAPVRQHAAAPTAAPLARASGDDSAWQEF